MKMKRIVLLLGIATALVAFLVTTETRAQQTEVVKDAPTLQPNKMNYQDVYPVFITKDLKACKDFYTKWFNMQVAFEASFFVLLVSGGEKSFSVGFLNEVHPSSPPSNPAMNAQAGVFLTLQVVDATTDFKRLKDGGLLIRYALTDEPWGQRRFGVTDTNGMYVDIVEQIEPKKGFWDAYQIKD
jgi:catechol 2,3-dioxygenase-like lactoylglutathione lyase family enzyme